MAGVHHGAEPPRKRVKLDQPVKRLQNFTDAHEIRASFHNQNQDGLTEALTTLRNQLTVKVAEDHVSPQDERLILVKRWVEIDPGLGDVFDIWEGTNQRQLSQLPPFVSVLTAVLTLLSVHYPYHSMGLPILKKLLSPHWSRRLNLYLGSAHTELILVTLKLLTRMSAFAGGRERKALLEAFAWEAKSLPKLLHMRRKSKTGVNVDALARPDIRTLYLLFILSFVDSDSPSTVKQVFLEQHKDVFLSIFKGLLQDSYSLVRKVLEVCWASIWSDPKIKRTLKIGLFNESTIAQIAKLYDRISPEGPDLDQIPADLGHYFLLAICTRPGTGICFKDRGWYHHESVPDNTATGRGGKIYNKILANVLRTLKVNDDSRQQELAIKIMSACPELVAGYWSSAALTLEPRLSSKWIANISFFGSVISLRIPSTSFLLPNGIPQSYLPSPPPLSTILENILPSVNVKSHFSKGLQSNSGLVQHCSAVSLIKCLRKFEDVIRFCEEVANAHEEDFEDGQWRRRRREVEREVRKRVPDFQVVVAFSQHKWNVGPEPKPNPTKIGLLMESAQRLLWYYQKCLPEVVAEARFDVGKLLTNFEDVTDDLRQRGPENTVSGMDTIRKLHLLRLLKDSDQFSWTGKIASSSHTYLYALLKAYNVASVSVTRIAISSVITHIFSGSILFQEDSEEPEQWLSCLPTTRRALGAEAPDGASLTDEGTGIIVFLDDCIQRCLKTPYRYIEEMQVLAQTMINPDSSDDHPEARPSPLLMTVVEQLEAKLKNSLLSGSDTLAFICFLRKLLFRLSSKQQSLTFLQAVADKVDDILRPDHLFPQYSCISKAIRREIDMMHFCLRHLSRPRPSSPVAASLVVQNFLTQVEQLPVPSSESLQIQSAFELVDWLRLFDQQIDSTDFRRLVSAIERFHKSALRELFEDLSPFQCSLWSLPDILSRSSELRKEISFEYLFLHTEGSNLVHSSCRDVLVGILFAHSSSITQVKRAVCLVSHSVASSGNQVDLLKSLLLLLAAIVRSGKQSLSAPDVATLKEYLFWNIPAIKGLCLSHSLATVVQEGLNELVHTALDPTIAADRHVIAEISTYWLTVVKDGLFPKSHPLTPLSLAWIEYLDPEHLLALVNSVSNVTGESQSPGFLEVMRSVLVALQRSNTSSPLDATARIPLRPLLSLYALLPASSVLEDMMAKAIGRCLPVCLDGFPFSSTNTTFDMASLSTYSEGCWPRHLDPSVKDLEIQTFLTREPWSDPIAQIVSGILYLQPTARTVFLQWIGGSNCATRSVRHLAIMLYAYLDSSAASDEVLHEAVDDLFVSVLSRLVDDIAHSQNSGPAHPDSVACIYLISSSLHHQQRTQFDQMLEAQIQGLSVEDLSSDLLRLGNQLNMTGIAKNSVTSLVDHALRWAVHLYSGAIVETEDTQRNIELLARMIETISTLDTQYTETVLSVVTQKRLADITALKLASVVTRATHLKPVTVNRLLQNVIQHPQFFKLCAASGQALSSSRDSIVHFLSVLFNLFPSNTCQPSHVQPLVRIYGGTVSDTDREILSIFRLFENQRRISVISLLNRWSSSDAPSSNSIEAIQSLDPIQMLRTCLTFPTWRRLQDQTNVSRIDQDIQQYDPVFSMLLFSCMLNEGPPSSALGWVEVFRTNIVCLFVRCLSSKDGDIRDMALCQIVGLWKSLQAAEMQETPYVSSILDLLRDILPPPASIEPPRRLPSYTSLIILHGLRGIFYPSNFIYPLTARFMLQRPQLDTNDVPMLYSMLYSNSDEWKKERGWIIRFLSDGMISTDDWRVFKKRHTWELLASLFQSCPNDRNLRDSILGVLANLTCIPQATMSLLLKSGLLTWIEMQLHTSTVEGVTWLKITENILTASEHAKLESATSGEWRLVICRCISMILMDYSVSSIAPILALAAPLILRLSLLPGTLIPQLPTLVMQAVDGLRLLETTILTFPSETIAQNRKRLSPPYTAHTLHDDNEGKPVQIWGDVVEALWQVTMSLEEKISAWDVLTSRLLIWRSMVGADGSDIGEWARRAVVRNLTNEVMG